MAIRLNEAKRRLAEVMQRYNLSRQEVMLAHLLAAGMPYGDVFEVIFRSSALDKDSACRRYVTGKPQIDVLINALKNNDVDKQISETIIPKAEDIDLRTKDGVLTALEKELANVSDSKQRTDIIAKIADLQRMKNEEDKQTRELIHYYLPLRCEECPFKQRYDKDNNVSKDVIW